MTDGLADLAFGADIVEHVVRDLKRKAKFTTVSAQRGSSFAVQATEQPTDIAARCDEQRCLRLDSAHVLANVGAVAVSDRLLAHLARADTHHGPREDRHDLRLGGDCGQLISLGEIEVPDDDCGLIAQR